MACYLFKLTKKRCNENVEKISAPLHQHLHQHGVDYLQFSFRWMNNLLTREIPLHCTIRLWDTYLAESDRFASFQLYVCAAFLLRWRRHLLLQPDFQVSSEAIFNRLTLKVDPKSCQVRAHVFGLKKLSGV